ncbi:uncharacterized protein N7498_006311 [Penicillium cinerascens]|uniref:F-box domain-containing protein n=1 Tax=Penicillium cinerascens TaxID=70096 RepID=A0A9W9SX50_9EURO|nr:uncharacterized protein N7498_006311 [Penicillium cinerascens]KAJ5201648.1 hypothetical protein N7498_006311 [Penicillium cinerascens]
MTRVPGKELGQVYETLSIEDRTSILQELKSYLEVMRGWSNPWGGNRICSLLGTAIRSVRVPNHLIGPFESEEEFNQYLIEPSWSGGFKSDLAYNQALDVARGIEKIPHRILFTHGDIKHHNIMVSGGRITGFLDWESAGWYPEYWDFTTALRFAREDFWWYNFAIDLGGGEYLAELKCERALTPLTMRPARQCANMTQLIELPPELLVLVMSLADTKSLKSLSLTNRQLSSYASRGLFRIVHLYNDEERCETFKSIITHSTFKRRVQKIHLNTVEYDYGSDDEGEEEPPENWRKLLTKLKTLPNLQSVVLRFDKNCAVDPDYADKPQTELYRATVLRWLFAGLASMEQPLKEFAIQNLQNISPRNKDIIAQIKRLLQGLESLRLNVVHELDSAAPESELERPAPHKFFTQILPSIWLKPTMGSLQNLSLYSSFYWGFYPRANLDGVHFPHLKSLTLGRFSFVDDKQLDWILAHSSTLQELYLDNCAILVGVAIDDSQLEVSKCQIPESDMELKEEDEFHHVYPRRWHDYFSSIQEGLPNLREFGFGVSASWDEDVLPFETEKKIVPALMRARYMAFEGSLGPSPFVGRNSYLDMNPESEWPDCDEEDRRALKELYLSIGKKADYGRIAATPQRTVEDLVQVGSDPWGDDWRQLQGREVYIYGCYQRPEHCNDLEKIISYGRSSKAMQGFH